MVSLQVHTCNTVKSQTSDGPFAFNSISVMIVIESLSETFKLIWANAVVHFGNSNLPFFPWLTGKGPYLPKKKK